MEQKDNMTDPLKKIELFKAIASPAYIVASLEHFNEVKSLFFVKGKENLENNRGLHYYKHNPAKPLSM